jgi:alpha-glucosidase
MTYMGIALIAAWLLCAGMSSAAAAEDIQLAGPSGKVQLNIARAGANLQYSVTFRDKPVIEASALGITVDGTDLSKGVEVRGVERYQRNESYPWYGAHSTATDRCNGARIRVVHLGSGTEYQIDARAYDDGVAFRHLVPGQGTRTPDEATVFRLPAGSTLWYHGLEDHYEAQHARKGLRALPPGGWLAPPVTVMLPQGGGYASITEGGLRSYSGMVLQADAAGALHARLGHAAPASYPFRLRYPDDVERLTKPATARGPITTPWRVVLIGGDLNALVASDVVHNVAEPPDPKLFPKGIKTEWIKPGRSLWSYLDGGDNTLEGMKEFSRLAGELGFEYNLLEGFWSRWPEAQLKELVDYSRERRVGIIVWKHSNQLRTPERRREFFALLSRNGVAGAKIDFFDHEHREVVDLYEELLRGAAEHKLVLDFHGANKPTGLERTWPNLLGLEGIRGMEMGPPYAMHEVTLPFTRMLAGLADYTPTHFGARKLADTTWAHQVGNAILLQAPLLVYAAHPANLLSNPMAEVIKSIPSVWDETLVLPLSSIGEVAAFARRSGNTWFLAVNNGPVARAVSVDLSFLGPGSYRSVLLRDTGEAADVKVEHLTSQSRDTLHIDLRSGGGFVGLFSK